MNTKSEYFTRFPNDYVQGNIKTKYGISRKFYITYILIDRYRSYEDFSWITIRKILEFYGYKTTKRKPKAFHDILDVLEYMINNKMIEVKQDLDSIGYDTGIEIKIIPENLSMSKDTLNQCLSYLTSNVDDKQPLLIKKEVGSIQPDPSQPPQNTPNIYVLNKEGYEQEIEWAIYKMLQIYNVESFGELTGNYKD